MILNNDDVSKKIYFKFFLKEFYTEQIDKNIYHKIKDYSPFKNLIIQTPINFNYIKSAISSLLLKAIKENSNFEYYAASFYKLVDLAFKQQIEQSQRERETIEDVQTLILYEFNDIEHSYYQPLIESTVSLRIMKDKNNILVFTKKSPSDVLNRELIKNFTIINLNNISISSKSKSSEIF